jgi:DNA uptake protein ComE-like DNA-binding protein
VTSRRSRAALIVAGLALAVAAAQRMAPAAPASCRAPVLVAMRGALVAVSCARSGAPLEGAARLAFRLPLDVNREGVRALEALPGIGAGRAAAIVAARSAAPFCDVRELERVPGIGRATLARLAGQVMAGPDPGCAVARS